MRLVLPLISNVGTYIIFPCYYSLVSMRPFQADWDSKQRREIRQLDGENYFRFMEIVQLLKRD